MNSQETPQDGALLDSAVRIWRKAQIVHQSPSWENRPEARAIAEEIARHPEYESALFDLLADSNQLVVAFSLITLEMMGSSRLRELPIELLENRSNITLLFGSFVNKMDLGGLARQIQKRAAATS
jgi:hypothetical protein